MVPLFVLGGENTAAQAWGCCYDRACHLLLEPLECSGELKGSICNRISSQGSLVLHAMGLKQMLKM